METLVIVLYVLMLLTGLLRLSMFGTRTLAVIALLWGGVTGALTLWLSEAEGIGSMRLVGESAVMAAIMAESIVLFAYCVSYGSRESGRLVNRLLRYYPGVMLWVPLSAVSVWLLMNVTAISFEAAALLAGVGVMAAVFGGAKILGAALRYENSRVGVLYVADMAVFLLCIVLSGL